MADKQRRLEYDEILEILLEKGIHAPDTGWVKEIEKAKDQQAALNKLLDEAKHSRPEDIKEGASDRTVKLAVAQLSMTLNPDKAVKEVKQHGGKVTDQPFPKGFEPFDIRVGIQEQEEKLTAEEEEELWKAQQALGKNAEENLLSAIIDAARFKEIRDPLFELLKKEKLPTEKEKLAGAVDKLKDKSELAFDVARIIRIAVDCDPKPEFRGPLGKAILAHTELTNEDVAKRARGSGPSARSAFNELVSDRAMDVHRTLMSDEDRVKALSAYHAEQYPQYALDASGFPKVSQTSIDSDLSNMLRNVHKALEARQKEITEEITGLQKEGKPVPEKLQEQLAEVKKKFASFSQMRAKGAAKPELPAAVGIAEQAQGGGHLAHEKVQLVPSRDKLTLFYGHVSGDCVGSCSAEQRLKAINDPEFVNWRILHEGNWAGNVYTKMGRMADGTKALLVDAVQPESGYTLNPKDLATGILKGLRDLADRTGHTLLFSENAHAWSNRDTMQKALGEHLRGKPTTTKAAFSTPVAYQSVGRGYLIYHKPKSPEKYEPPEEWMARHRK
ncbi:MAG TPA: hypothetical protein VGQ00_01005 [Candidatus Norongarragalinales archaeon]|jgi:hypothetical protein|nr:hypothetical protein [Candidatus Norongarragalinales archaeon]